MDKETQLGLFEEEPLVNPKEKPVEVKGESSKPVELSKEAPEATHEPITKENLQTAIDIYLTTLNKVEDKKIGQLVAQRSSQFSHYEYVFASWQKASEAVSRFSGLDVIAEPLTAYEQQLCHDILNDIAHHDAQHLGHIDSEKPDIDHDTKSVEPELEFPDGDDHRPWVPGKGYVN
ncbi:MAG TPA: hypothetical protein VHQ41_01700 [Patescibacteria group bacterium]|jgi:hypothetical protein|nr:hypothetical protein [Patescibacteria group bacterium]